MSSLSLSNQLVAISANLTMISAAFLNQSSSQTQQVDQTNAISRDQKLLEDFSGSATLRPEEKIIESQAVMYVVVVLSLYAFGIGLMMIKVSQLID